jgi:hypothetical protein
MSGPPTNTNNPQTAEIILRLNVLAKIEPMNEKLANDVIAHINKLEEEKEEIMYAAWEAAMGEDL